MNPENEEQKPVPQTLCGALQKEANCKCLVLSVLIYGCLAAVTWCRCANVTKIVFNFTTFPIKSTKHVSPCEDGYIYIPVAFMGMLYLVYLVECYHSPIRIDLLHAESQSGVLARLTQLRLAQPTIWWKAISYHYVRRKRQVMRYRNGDNFTTTQVYYERVNSHAATSFYFYDYCGSKDISKELVLDPKIPITKITLSKGFAFSNVRSATEFEEARSRFFAEQEFRDDYMEMREGLDLGVNFSPVTLVSVLGNPWFTRSYVYWCLSALLLSWPLRIIIECNTQYVNYQVTKLFGVNYDTPTNIQIHTSASQLSAPGSYMLAPSYSEALLMEPAAPPPQAAAAAAATAATVEQQQAAATVSNQVPSDMVPSYSEALLYQPVVDIAKTIAATGCECPCHSLGAATSTVSCASSESLQIPIFSRDESSELPGDSRAGSSSQQQQPAESNARICNGCLGARPQRTATTDHKRRRIGRDYSEPDLRRSAELLLLAELVNNATRCSGRSLENIVENVAEESSLEASGSDGPAIVPINPPGESTGAIPKQRPRLQANPLANERPLPSSASSSAYLCLRSILKQNRRKFNRETLEELQSLTRSAADDDNGNDDDDDDSCDCTGCRSDASAIERPDSLMINNIQRPPSCQFSVRRENSRTLIFASPIQVVCPTDPFGGRNLVQSDQPPNYEEALNLPVLSNARRSLGAAEGAAESAEQQSSSSSSSSSVPTSVVVTASGPRYTSLSVASTSSQSTGPKAPSANRSWNQSRATNTEQGPIIVKDDTRVAVIRSTSTQRSAGRNAETTAISLPTSIDGLTMPPDSRASSSTTTTASQTNRGNVEVATAATSASKGAAAGAPSSTSHGPSDPTKGKTKTRLTRSLTERRPSGNSTHDQSRRRNPALRNSFTERIDTGTRVPGIKRMNINIETSL